MSNWFCEECNEDVDTDFCILCGRGRPDLEKCISCGNSRGPAGERRGKFCGRCGHQWGAPLAPVEGIPIPDEEDREREMEEVNEGRPDRDAPSGATRSDAYRADVEAQEPPRSPADDEQNSDVDDPSLDCAQCGCRLVRCNLRSFNCDECRENYRSPDHKSWGCRPCDYDICDTCVRAGKQPSRRERHQSAGDRCCGILFYAHQIILSLVVLLFLIWFAVLGLDMNLGLFFGAIYSGFLYVGYLFVRLRPGNDAMRRVLATSGFSRLIFYIILVFLTLQPVAVLVLKAIPQTPQTESINSDKRCMKLLWNLHQVLLWILILVAIFVPHVILADKEDRFGVIYGCTFPTGLIYIFYLVTRLVPGFNKRLNTVLEEHGCCKLSFYLLMVFLTLEPVAGLILGLE